MFDNVKLGQVASVNYGYTESASSEAIGPKFLRITDIQEGNVDWTTVPYCEINQRDFDKHRLEAGDIVFARTGATTGKSFLVQEPPASVPASYLIRLRITDEKLLPDYLALFFQTSAYWEAIKQGSSGSAQGGFNASKLKEIELSLPPLEEQKRIVAVLDQAFTALDRARANAEANLADAAEFIEREIDELFRPRAGSGLMTLGDVADIQSGAGFPNKDQGRTSGRYPFYKVSDMNLAGNEWRLSRANNYIDEPVRQRLRAAIFPQESIVFPKVGGAIATNKKRVIEVEGCVDNNVMGLIPDPEVILPDYLHEWLYATDIYEFSNKANPPSITQGTVREWPIPCPDFDTQSAVVKAIRDLREQINNLTDHYHRTLIDLADLRQSLLQKAFAGELV